jgi:hypothetical protein
MKAAGTRGKEVQAGKGSDQERDSAASRYHGARTRWQESGACTDMSWRSGELVGDGDGCWAGERGGAPVCRLLFPLPTL